MKVQGVVIQVKYESKPPKQKVKIQEGSNSMWVELRGKLKEIGKYLKEGDKLSVEFISNAQESKTNTFNNLIAKTIERI
ncbi:hypothetical protein [Tenacibaculum caenipelagi]|uniref:Uncharacterized protein n=1 Tax=Tenacibaculum caenipelagi TaxID=1325435 RepID=A0A4R6TCX5_9FLAO|nr:hypothetical protein [Tenacibaculum caenipelagi]TDQ27675.1 hypothetical protein DFQ07_1526 [Tenacibaculum caenipelagi]